MMRVSVMQAMSSQTELGQYHRDGKLCLFVGAGVSMSCGIPGWDTLSKLVIETAWPNREKRFDFERLKARVDIALLNPLDAMRMARRQLKGDFSSAVSKCLYSKEVTLSETIEAIISLSNVRRICCFNFDDLLEKAYGKKGVKYCALTAGDAFPRNDAQVLVFHPHGFLPSVPHTRVCSNKKIILSEDDYHELYTSPYCWANLIQLKLLMTFNVLFVGCSLKDPNIRRLLDTCKKLKTTQRHFAIMKKPDYNGVRSGIAR